MTVQVPAVIIAALESAWLSRTDEPFAPGAAIARIDFSFPPELAPAAAEMMAAAAEIDAAERLESGVEIPADPNAPWGKWHRAANICNAAVRERLPAGDWSWLAFMRSVEAK